MILLRKQVDIFIDFMCKTYGVVPTSNLNPNELFRTVLKDKLFIVRNMTDSSSSDVVEVFCSDKELIKSIDELWTLVQVNSVEENK